mmetsp:Transcript_58843/g.164335  ORF Transcript_58843/g.164335 Transcript_58843/m.164335 type:complete len:788 (-) Transcript_58843:69-2432(-)
MAGAADFPHSRRQQAVIAFLRAVADGELAVEEARCKLCDLRNFDLYEAFICLQLPGIGSTAPRGWLDAADLKAWMASHSHRLLDNTLEDVSAMLVPYANRLGELRYEGFLRMVLPKDPRNAWLQEVLLARGANLWSMYGEKGCQSSDVNDCLCRLFENEIDLYKHLRFQRKMLRDLAVDEHNVAPLLELEIRRGDTLLHPDTLRIALIDKLHAMSPTQCDALLRRISPSGELRGLMTLAELLSFFFSHPPAPILPMATGANGLGNVGASCVGGRFAAKEEIGLGFERQGLPDGGGRAAAITSPTPSLLEPSGPLLHSGEVPRSPSALSPPTPFPPFLCKEASDSKYGGYSSTTMDSYARPKSSSYSEKAVNAVCNCCGNTGRNFFGKACFCPYGDQAVDVSCRSCGNKGKDLYGKPCFCSYGDKVALATCRSCCNTGRDYLGKPCFCFYGKQAADAGGSDFLSRAQSNASSTQDVRVPMAGGGGDPAGGVGSARVTAAPEAAPSYASRHGSEEEFDRWRRSNSDAADVTPRSPREPRWDRSWFPRPLNESTPPLRQCSSIGGCDAVRRSWELPRSSGSCCSASRDLPVTPGRSVSPLGSRYRSESPSRQRAGSRAHVLGPGSIGWCHGRQGHCAYNGRRGERLPRSGSCGTLAAWRGRESGWLEAPARSTPTPSSVCGSVAAVGPGRKTPRREWSPRFHRRPRYDEGALTDEAWRASLRNACDEGRGEARYGITPFRPSFEPVRPRSASVGRGRGHVRFVMPEESGCRCKPSDGPAIGNLPCLGACP